MHAYTWLQTFGYNSEGKYLEKEKCAGRAILFFYFQKQSLWSPVCFFYLQAGIVVGEEAGRDEVLGARE